MATVAVVCAQKDAICRHVYDHVLAIFVCSQQTVRRGEDRLMWNEVYIDE
jgi:hypothetical protein